MKELLIDKTNINILEEIGDDLAGVYKYDFSIAPWYEKSKCATESCSVGFSAEEPGNSCDECGGCLDEAYNSRELIEQWKSLLLEQDGFMEVALDDGLPLRTTIARPTTPRELYERKYSNVDAMQVWLDEVVPSELVWIEDTFADLKRSPRGNLRNRAKTLGRIATQYGGLQVATRTLSPAIVRATVRDLPEQTDVYVGSLGVGIEQTPGARKAGGVPDRRTFLVIDGEGI